jgi:hypothetical protein
VVKNLHPRYGDLLNKNEMVVLYDPGNGGGIIKRSDDDDENI